MFVHYNGKAVNTITIGSITFDSFVKYNYIRIHYLSGGIETVEGVEALNVLMTLVPGALEGKRAKYHRHAWAIHNLIGHPLMQVCSWLKLTALGIKIHDATVPEPEIEE